MNAANPVIRYATHGDSLDITKLNKLEQAQFILYQMVYVKYLELATCDLTPVVAEYVAYVSFLIKSMPRESNLFGTDKDIYNAIYNVIHNFDPRVINWRIIDEVLSFPVEEKSSLRGHCPSRDFYLPVLSALGFGYPSDVYHEGKKPGVELYLPCIQTYPNSPMGSNPLNGTIPTQKFETPHLYIEFRIINLLDYDFTLIRKLRNYSPNSKLSFFEYLSQFNFTQQSPDDLIAILSNFSLEYCVRNCFQGFTKLFAACYSVITDKPVKDIDIHCSGPIPSAFLDMLKILQDYHRIGNLEDTRVFSFLINKFEMPNSDAVIGYLAKPIHEVTANEALAFRNSPLYNVIPDKMLNLSIYKSGTEAIDDVAIEDDMGDPMTGSEDSGNMPDGDEPPAMPDDSFTPDDTSPPPRDPTKLLIELARSDETFPDYMYRQLVSARIRDFLNNTPKNLPTKEVLLLKKWLTHWINLVSVNTIKDFLSRLSFRLNDLELTQNTI